MTTASKPAVDKETGEVFSSGIKPPKQKTKQASMVTAPTTLPTEMAVGGSLSVMSPEVAKQAIDYLQEIKKSILKVNVDYGVIPGTGKKPVLFKPGAQKLAVFFNLTAHYTDVEVIEEDFMVEWQYTYYDKYKKAQVTKTTKGQFAYRVKCEMRHRGTDVIWGTGYGMCSKTEKGKQTAEANTILKMAEKRAMLQATLDATFSAELFTQDVDGYDRDEPPPQGNGAPPSQGNAPPGSNDKPASDKQVNYIAKGLVPKKEMPTKLSISAENFLTKKNLQTADNASKLIEALMRCPAKGTTSPGEPPVDPPHEDPEPQAPPVDPPSSKGAMAGYMKKAKGDIIDLIGHEAARLWGSAKEEATFYELSRSAGMLSSTTLDSNNKGQLARLLDHMTNTKKGGTE